MSYFIKEREVKNLCRWHGVKYGKQKAPKKPLFVAGICDVCEATRPVKGAVQSVLPVDDWQGIMVNDSYGLIIEKK